MHGSRGRLLAYLIEHGDAIQPTEGNRKQAGVWGGSCSRHSRCRLYTCARTNVQIQTHVSLARAHLLRAVTAAVADVAVAAVQAHGVPGLRVHAARSLRQDLLRQTLAAPVAVLHRTAAQSSSSSSRMPLHNNSSNRLVAADDITQ